MSRAAGLSGASRFGVCDPCPEAGCDWSSFLIFLVIEPEGKQALVNLTLEAQGMMPSFSLCVMY